MRLEGSSNFCYVWKVAPNRAWKFQPQNPWHHFFFCLSLDSHYLTQSAGRFLHTSKGAMVSTRAAECLVPLMETL